MEQRAPLTPELYVTDLRRSLSFYLEGIGFTLEFERPEQGFAAIYYGASRLMLEVTPSLEPSTPQETLEGQWRPAPMERPFGRGISLELEVDDVDAIHARVVERGLTPLVAMHEKSYEVGAQLLSVRQFVVMDPDGYLIRPSQNLRIR